MKKLAVVSSLALATATLTACAPQQTVILATHDSFAISDSLVEEFEAQSGYQLEIVRFGDTGSLVSRLALTVSAPLADAYYGIDNTFLERARTVGIIDGEPAAVNFGDVCFNFDLGWLETAGIVAPTHWEELAKPEYAALTVITDPRMSSPGMSFLLSTGQYFETVEETAAYWEALKANDVRVAASWEDAYFLDFTRYGGDRPIVLSYASSPAAELDAAGSPQTAALRGDCFRQIEYAGVLPNAANSGGATALVEFLGSNSFQEQLPSLMFVYPTSEAVSLDAQWLATAPPATSFFTVPSELELVQGELLDIWQQVFNQ